MLPDIQHNVSLKSLNTFAIDAIAENYARISSMDKLVDLLSQNKEGNLIVWGGGSNILLAEEVIKDLVIHVDLKGVAVTHEHDDVVVVKASSGENWHQFVCWCLGHGYGGLENLSLIPGSVGAAPIQNIGAYGAELKDVLAEVEAINVAGDRVRTFSRDECEFGYRDSVFKGGQCGQWIITSVSFSLSKRNHQLRLDYGLIRETLTQSGITSPTIEDVAKAVVTIRQQRLPDPDKIPNAGSFFKNPVIEENKYQQLKADHPGMPGYVLDSGLIKVPAAWLIEQCGWKGKRKGRCSVHADHALVLVNDNGASGSEILALAKEIQASVRKQFQLLPGIEVNVLGGT